MSVVPTGSRNRQSLIEDLPSYDRPTFGLSRIEITEFRSVKAITFHPLPLNALVGEPVRESRI